MSKSPLIRRCLPGLAAVAVLLLAGSAAAADPVRYTAEKKLRLHIDTDLFGWTQVRPWYEPNQKPDPNPHERTNIIGFGAMRPLMIDRNGFDALGGGLLGAGSSMFSLGFGYGVHRHVVIGARFGLAFDRIRDRSDADDMAPDSFSADRFFSVAFMPYIEVLPIPEGRILPYFQFRAGLAGSAYGNRTHVEFGGVVAEDSLTRISTISPVVGTGFGAHFFLIPQFSIDLGLHFDYRWVFAGGHRKDYMDDANSTENDWQRGAQAFNLGLNTGLSVWFF